MVSPLAKFKPALQLAQFIHQRAHLIAGVQSARARQNPDPGAFEAARLLAERCGGRVEGMTISAHAEKRHEARLVTPHFACESRAAGDKFGRCELIGARRGPADQIGESEPQADKGVLLRRVEPPAGKTRCMAPEPETV